jgi:PAS domain S-box-containing protein
MDERAQATEALRQNETLFSTIIDQAPGAVFVLDSQLCFQQLNSRTLAVFGHLGQLIGRPFAEVMDILWGVEVSKQILDIFRHTLETGERYIAPRFSEERKDIGERQAYDYEVQRVSLPAGGYGVVCYFIDITERTRAAEALRASEEQFASIFNQTTGGIAELDLSGRFLLVNDRFCQLMGRSREEVLRLRMQDITHPGDLEASNRKLEELIRGSVQSFVIEKRYLRRDGSVLWAQADVAAIRDAKGCVRFVTAAITDISERHMLEDALVERAAELGRADRSKDEFLAMLAHELRNPLAPLRNAAEILQMADASADERDQAQRIIGRQIENMGRMIDDLLDVSRITEGKIELREQPVALVAILTAATSLARSGCAARHQELTVSIPDEAIFLNADATRLEQVFSNLLGNACKYGGDGCHISLSAERGASKEPPEVIVHVRDDGVGIDPDLLPRVFDLFVQATRSLDRAHGGLGIGLTLVSRLVKLHGE